MKRIPTMFLAVITLIALITSCSSNEHCKKHFFTKQDYEDIREGLRFLAEVEKLKIGMTLDEAKAVMGEPVSIDGSTYEGAFAIWLSRNMKHVVHAQVAGHTVEAIMWKDKKPDGTWVPEGVWVPKPDGTWEKVGD